eukprot:gene49356-60418_t
MFGPGLLSGCAINEEVSFMIQARDDNNQNRTTGGDEFAVMINMLGAGEAGESVRLMGVLIDDLQNGKYLVTYKAKYAAKYEIRVDFMGTYGGKAGELRGSGVVVEFAARAPRSNNRMSGDLVINSLKQDVNELHKFVDEMSKIVLTRIKNDSWSSDEQIQVLMKIKEALLLIESKTEATTLLVERSECTLKHLVEESIAIPGLEETLYNAKYLWEKILKEAPQIQSKIAPMMRSHNSKIKNDIVSYEAHITAFKAELQKGEFYFYATGSTKSMELITAAKRLCHEERTTCSRMTH